MSETLTSRIAEWNGYRSRFFISPSEIPDITQLAAEIIDEMQKRLQVANTCLSLIAINTPYSQLDSEEAWELANRALPATDLTMEFPHD